MPRGDRGFVMWIESNAAKARLSGDRLPVGRGRFSGAKPPHLPFWGPSPRPRPKDRRTHRSRRPRGRQRVSGSPQNTVLWGKGGATKRGECRRRVRCDRRVRRTDRVSRYAAEKKRLIKSINDLEDSFLRLILSCRFVSKLSWRQVARAVGGGNTADGVRKAVERFFRENKL